MFDVDESYDLSDNRRKGMEKARVRFYETPKLDKEETEKQGRPIFKNVEYVEIVTPADRENVACRPVTKLDKEIFSARYLAFKAGKDHDAASGTLLSAWVLVDKQAKIPPERIAELNFGKIHTVEQLAGLSDEICGRFGLHTREERDRAKAYLFRAGQGVSEGAVQQELAKRDAEIAELRKMVAGMQAMQNAKSDGDVEATRRPGRTKKEEAA